MSDLVNAQREFGNLAAVQARKLAAGVQPPSAAVGGSGLALGTGHRVLDLVTGEAGVVLDGSAELLVTAPGSTARSEQYSIKLADGSTVTRKPDQLAALPADVNTALLTGETG